MKIAPGITRQKNIKLCLFFCCLHPRNFMRDGTKHDFVHRVMQAALEFGCQALDRRLQHIRQAVAHAFFEHEVDAFEHLVQDALTDLAFQSVPFLFVPFIDRLLLQGNAFLRCQCSN